MLFSDKRFIVVDLSMISVYVQKIGLIRLLSQYRNKSYYKMPFQRKSKEINRNFKSTFKKMGICNSKINFENYLLLCLKSLFLIFIFAKTEKQKYVIT